MPRIKLILLFTFVLLLLGGVLVIPVVRTAWELSGHASDERLFRQLSDLDMAINAYVNRYGGCFPDTGERQIERHLAKTRPWIVDVQSRVTQQGRNLGSIDEAESLVAFLGKEMDAVLGTDEHAEYSFPLECLQDADGDGWQEYVVRDGEPFRMLRGKSAVLSRESQRLLSMQDLATGIEKTDNQQLFMNGEVELVLSSRQSSPS